MPQIDETRDLMSVIMTVLNGGQWIDNCFESIIKQTIIQTYKRQSQITLPSTNVDHLKQQQQQQQQYYEAQNPLMSTMTNTLNAETTANVTATSRLNEIHMECHTKSVQIEVCVFDDCSCDNTLSKLRKWRKHLKERYNIQMKIIENTTGKTKGVGYGRNRAIEASQGNYLCFQDIDDEMLPQRIYKQYNLAKKFKNAIIGSKFERIPSYATCRFTKWANELHVDKLMQQIYTSNGPTVIMPTWFCHRQVYQQIPGGFSEEGKGCPEDLLFFYKHLDNKGLIKRVDECLLKYRYHLEATTFTVQAKTIWQIRLKYLLDNVLKQLPWSQGFSIWNAGKQGRKFFRDLPEEQKKNVKAFCDVDKNKINKLYKYYDAHLRQTTYSIPIKHFSQVQPPVVICMKLDLTNGHFEMNLQSLNFIEDKDYVLFT